VQKRKISTRDQSCDHEKLYKQEIIGMVICNYASVQRQLIWLVYIEHNFNVHYLSCECCKSLSLLFFVYTAFMIKPLIAIFLVEIHNFVSLVLNIFMPFLTHYFARDDSISQKPFFSCALHIQYTLCPELTAEWLRQWE